MDAQGDAKKVDRTMGTENPKKRMVTTTAAATLSSRLTNETDPRG